MTQNPTRLAFKRVKNPNVIQVIGRLDWCNTPIKIVFRGQNLSDIAAEVGPIGTQILSALMDIDGITEITITPYELQIQKGLLFSWEELIPQVNAALVPYTQHDMVQLDPDPDTTPLRGVSLSFMDVLALFSQDTHFGSEEV